MTDDLSRQAATSPSQYTLNMAGFLVFNLRPLRFLRAAGLDRRGSQYWSGQLFVESE